MKMKDSAHDFWVLGLAVLNMLKGKPLGSMQQRYANDSVY